MNELRDKMHACHLDIFGPTPLDIRLADVYEEAEELRYHCSPENMKEETSDLLSSILCLAFEQGWTIDELVQMNLDKMAERKANKHYERLEPHSLIRKLNKQHD